MKQLWRIFLFDIRMSFKNFMGAYLLIIPMVILLILRSFLPAVDSSSANFAVINEGPNAVDQELIATLDEIGDVSFYSTIEELEDRMAAIGEIEGLYWDPVAGQYVSLVEKTGEDNELFTLAARYIRQQYLGDNYPELPRLIDFSAGVPPELSDRTEISPVATMGGSLFIVFISIMTAFMMGLAIVEDKDQGTILALRISPVSSSDYYIGRSLFPFLVTIAYSIIGVFMLGLAGINIMQMLTVVIPSFATAMVLGLFIGGMGKNEIEAMGIGKVSAMLFMFVLVAAALLPDNWHWTLWWMPVYWIFDALEEVFIQQADWFSVGWKSLLALALAGGYFLLLRKRIVRGLGATE
jgi:ABC-2 type transport system permease protein